jgi:hypothetical protein
VNGPRFGLNKPRVATQTPQQQLQAVAGPRYHQPAWFRRQR